VLLPVTVLARRAYAAEVIGAALTARAGGRGHRPIGVALGVPAATVRGWLRVMTGRLGSVRVFLLRVAARAGVDLAVPDAAGSPWRDLLNALDAARQAVACSAGRLLAPGWPVSPTGSGGNTSCL